MRLFSVRKISGKQSAGWLDISLHTVRKASYYFAATDHLNRIKITHLHLPGSDLCNEWCRLHLYCGPFCIAKTGYISHVVDQQTGRGDGIRINFSGGNRGMKLDYCLCK